MAINCPYCQFSITVKNPKPGSYTPKCPKCKLPFSLNVKDSGDDSSWTVTAIPGQGPEASVPVFQQPAPESSIPTGKFKPANPHEATEPDAGAPPKKPSLEATLPTGKYQPVDPAKAVKPSAKPVSQQTTNIEATAPPGVKSLSASSANLEATAPPAPTPKKPSLEATAPGAARTVFDKNEATAAGTCAPSEEGGDNPDFVIKGETEQEIPSKLGGYEVVKELGRGGMGAVYLARQVSLDRPVALKVMNSRWASDPVFLARFTREAYAAAQLVHHNVVQIYDIGAQDGLNFFSMEFVEGTSLGELVRKGGQLKPEEAVGYTLQAARGLKFAHDRGMIHRDVKPDNLMLNSHGIVKVADLGLVKTPAMSPTDDAAPMNADTAKSLTGLRSLPTDVTNAFVAMGSPAYMSPEQCRDAASVDARADIYSLGCTMYVLLTGQVPFKANTAIEVMSKHAFETPPPPETIAPEVPRPVSATLMKMLAKAPDDRQQSMGAVIQDLEKCLGGGLGKFAPTEEHLKTLEGCVQRYASAPAAKLRKTGILGFFALSVIGILGSLIAGSGQIAAGFVALLVSAPLTYFVINGLSRKTYLFSKAREVVFGSRWTDWALAIVGGALFVGVLFLLGLLWAVLGFSVAGAALAFAFKAVLDRKLAAQRATAIADCESLLKRLRLHGAPEDQVRLFVAKFAGDNWEEFFEQLFGFQAKLSARAAIVAEGADANRSKFGGWREPIAAWLDGIVKARREAFEKKLLKAVEARKLEAEGVDKREAAERAEAAAERMVEVAAEIKAQPASMEETSANAPRVNVRKMLDEAERPAQKLPKKPINPVKLLMDVILGPKLRFLLGALLIAGGALWIRQNLSAATFKGEGIEQKAQGLIDAFFKPEPAWSPLNVSWLPSFVSKLFDHLNPIVAGLLLLVSLFFRGAIMGLFLLIAAAVTLLGHHLGLPDLGPVKGYQGAMILGVAIALLGFVLARKKE